MRCAYCDIDDTKVIETRESSDATRRRRECLTCKKRFTTYERPEIFNITVIKKSGEKQSFDREKLKEGMMKACEKRPVLEQQIDQAVDQTELRLRRRTSTEITSKELGRLVLLKLKKLDKVAYIRFASVYREFADIASFEVELKKIIQT